MNKLIILGYGGTCFDIADVAKASKDYDLVGFLDDSKSTATEAYPPVLGKLEDAKLFGDAFFVFGIGSPTSFLNRERILSKCGIPAHRFANLIHPSVTISNTASLGRGVVVLGGSQIGAKAIIDNHVIVLQNCVLSHDCHVQSFSILSSGANVSGHVVVESNCYIGSGVNIRERLTIGARSLVGLGSNVIRDLPPEGVYVGSPASMIKK